MSKEQTPSILGFSPTNSNKDLSDRDNWGKNQFPNIFPIGLACYQHRQDIQPVYLTLDSDLDVRKGNVSVTDIFGLPPFSDNLYYSFESDYEYYRPYVNGVLNRIDLVTEEIKNGLRSHLRPIEIKLTALPDNRAVDLSEEDYGSEIVVRPDTIVYLALSIIQLFDSEPEKLREHLAPVCEIPNIDWMSVGDVRPLINSLKKCIDGILLEKIELQFPYLMQPIWKTDGKSISLEENCFDIFMWSNFAFTRLFMDAPLRTSDKISRRNRTIVWLARMLYEYTITGKLDYQHIIDDYTYNTKNDKAFAVSGAVTNPYMKCDELTTPRVTKDALKKIILNGGEKYLSPERRLDAAVQALNISRG